MNKNYKSVQLPSNYAWELLENEIELEVGSKVTISIVQKLLELYALGVEYYESLRSYKYLYFQKKMNGLMMSPQVIQAMNSSVSPSKQPVEAGKSKSQTANALVPESKKSVKEQTEEHHKMLLLKSRQEEIEKQMMYSSAEVSVAKVKTIIENTEQQASELATKIKNELSKQNSEILDKVEKRRKRAAMSKSFSVADMTRNSSKDLLESTGEENNSPNNHPVKVERIKVDFGNIINENEEDEDDRERTTHQHERHHENGTASKELPTMQTEAGTNVQAEPEKQQQGVRRRNNTLRNSAKIVEHSKRKSSNHRTLSEGLPEVEEFSQTV